MYACLLVLERKKLGLAHLGFFGVWNMLIVFVILNLKNIIISLLNDKHKHLCTCVIFVQTLKVKILPSLCNQATTSIVVDLFLGCVMLCHCCIIFLKKMVCVIDFLVLNIFGWL